MKTSFFRVLMLAAVVVMGVGAATVRAEDLATVKARMSERISQIDRLKSAGAIGENNRGFLEVRGGGGGAADVIKAENADRETVYAAIAKKVGSTAERVGRARARRIAASSAPGVWLQKDDGSWYKK